MNTGENSEEYSQSTQEADCVANQNAAISADTTDSNEHTGVVTHGRTVSADSSDGSGEAVTASTAAGVGNEDEDEDFDEMPALEGADTGTNASASSTTAAIANAGGAKKKRKPRDPNKRRKIRKLLTVDDLSTQTLQAVKEEEERRKLLVDKAKMSRLQHQTNIVKIKPERADMSAFGYATSSSSSISTMTSSSISTSSSLTMTSTSGGLVKQENHQVASSSYFTAPCLTSLLTATDSIGSKKSSVVTTTTQSGGKSSSGSYGRGGDSSVICISSDDDDTNEPINISSDSSDEVICTSVRAKNDLFEDDMNNSGLHVNDERNTVDENGQVLVNIHHPPEEADIFLAPQIARIIRPHQIGGIRFMYDNIILTKQQYATSDGLGCILAHSMGLGKTLQVIGFIEIFLHHTTAKTALCVVPVNTLMNWVAEFDKWLPPASKLADSPLEDVQPRDFNVHVLRDIHKTIDARAKVVSTWQSEGGVLLLGYEMFRLLTTSRSARPRRSRKKPKKDVQGPIDVDEEDRKSNLHKSVIAMLLNPGPDLIICDEGHRIKNNGARTSERLKEIRTKRRVVLTGYPMQNNLVEYWCMVDFVRPDYLGSKREFYNLFERPITNGQGSDSTKEDRRLMRCRSDVLHNLLKGFVQRRSHSVLCHTLPEKKEYVLMVRFSEIQKKLYNTYMRTRSSHPGGEESSSSWTSCINPIRAFSVCCRIWNHPDVLYKTYLEQNEQSDLDIDLDYTILDSNGKAKAVVAGKESPDSRKKLKKRKINGSQDLAGAAVDDEEDLTTGMSPRSTSSDDKEKGENYEWINNMLDGYNMGSLELSGKMVILMHLLEKSITMGDKILVFSQSLSTLTLIEEFLSKTKVPANPESDPSAPLRSWTKGRSYLRLDGNTGSSEREKMINQFNNPANKETWLFLLSTKAGCLGINLIGANRVVVLDASWNPCYDAQAVCRCYRYGQQKKSYIYRLVADQSMEKKIYERQVSKQGMSDRVVDKLNPTQVFTKREVVSLLEFSDTELPKLPYDNLSKNIEDPVLLSLCKNHGGWLTRKPFTHESLLLDCKDQRLTKAERREALKNYEHDKRASLTLNYTRPSYISYYSSTGRSQSTNQQSSSNPIKLPTSRPSYNLTRDRKMTRPVASVQPYTTTGNSLMPRVAPISRNSSLPTSIGGHTNDDRQMSSSPFGQQQSNSPSQSGVMCHMVVATTDIPIPTASTLTMSSGGNITANDNSNSSRDRDRIRAGEEIMIMTTRKGTYIRTSENKIFTVKLNDTSGGSGGGSNSPQSWSPQVNLSASTTATSSNNKMMMSSSVQQQQQQSYQPMNNSFNQQNGGMSAATLAAAMFDDQQVSDKQQQQQSADFNSCVGKNNMVGATTVVNNNAMMVGGNQQQQVTSYQLTGNNQMTNNSFNNQYQEQQQQASFGCSSGAGVASNNWSSSIDVQNRMMPPPPPPPPLHNNTMMSQQCPQYNNNNDSMMTSQSVVQQQQNNTKMNVNNQQMMQQQPNYYQGGQQQQQMQYQQPQQQMNPPMYQQQQNNNGMFQQPQQVTNGGAVRYQQQQPQMNNSNNNYFQQPQQQQMFDDNSMNVVNNQQQTYQQQQQMNFNHQQQQQQQQNQQQMSLSMNQRLKFQQLCQQQQVLFDSYGGKKNDAGQQL